MNNKDNAVSVMQEFFPNGGRDYDCICKLFDAISEGKIPHLLIEKETELKTTLSREQMIEYICQAIEEGYNSYYGLPKHGISWLSDECLKVEYGTAWEYYNLAADANGKHPQRGLGE